MPSRARCLGLTSGLAPLGWQSDKLVIALLTGMGGTLRDDQPGSQQLPGGRPGSEARPCHVVVKTTNSQSSVYMRQRMGLRGPSGGAEGGLSVCFLHCITYFFKVMQ